MIENLRCGIDIEDIARFQKFYHSKNDNFLKRVFTSKELKYCFGKVKPAEHLAARFAAKEAFIKAMGGMRGFDYTDIEILTRKSGQPKLRFVRVPKLKVLVSLAHSPSSAAALVIFKEGYLIKK